jgi:ech hydrogenase subunit E
MTRNQAEVLGAVGPTARASNVAREIRVEAPYSMYMEISPTIILETNGDLEARFVVRIREMIESCRLINEILDTLPPGELTVRMPRRIKPAETIMRVEAPRGELFYFIKSNGTNKPERVKVRTPTICNMTSVVKLAIGSQLADIPVILAGIDPCFSCNDRSVLVDRRGNKASIWTWEELRQYGIRYYYGDHT